LVRPLAETAREFTLLEEVGASPIEIIFMEVSTCGSKICEPEQNCCGVFNSTDVLALLEIKEGSCTDTLGPLSSTFIKAAFTFCSFSCSLRLLMIDTVWCKMDSCKVIVKLLYSCTRYCKLCVYLCLSFIRMKMCSAQSFQLLKSFIHVFHSCSACECHYQTN